MYTVISCRLGKMSSKIIISESRKNKTDCKRFSGKVKFFNNKLGYGKITQNETFEVFHFHWSDIFLSNNLETEPKRFFRTVKKGQIVEFEIGIHKKYNSKFATKITEPGFLPIKLPKMNLFGNVQEKNPIQKLLCLNEELQQSSNTK